MRMKPDRGLCGSRHLATGHSRVQGSPWSGAPHLERPPRTDMGALAGLGGPCDPASGDPRPRRHQRLRFVAPGRFRRPVGTGATPAGDPRAARSGRLSPWRRLFSSCRTSASQWARPPCCKAPPSRCRLASASPWWAATAPASPPCCASPRARWRRSRHPLPPTRHHAALSPAGARLRRCGDDPRLGRSGAGAGRRPPPGTVPARAARPHGRGGPAAVVRRGGPAGRAGPGPGPLARHPAARRADEPPGPPGDLLAGGRTGRVRVRRW